MDSLFTMTSFAAGIVAFAPIAKGIKHFDNTFIPFDTAASTD